MARAPHRCAPYFCGVIQAAISTALAGAVGALRAGPSGGAVLAPWAAPWLAGRRRMGPIVGWRDTLRLRR